jgi:NAD(P)H-dependent FMN reductase
VGATIAAFDGFVFVTPEYSHSTSGVLKDAIDYLYAEWNNKAPAFVASGPVGGARAVEHLQLIMGELQMGDVRQQVGLGPFSDFENFANVAPAALQTPFVHTMLDQVVAWSSALAPLRSS